VKPGDPCQYYREGWRYGVIQEVPIKGMNKGRYRIKNPVTGLVWVDASDVNPVGDTVYHGPRKST
jgi:hypothetical protein